MKGILGKKIGMTQVFTKNGKLIPVTVIEVEPNTAPEESDNEIPFGNTPFSELDSIINAYEIHGNHKKVVELLKELAERRKQPEIIYCKDCENWDTTWQNDSAPNYHYCPMMDGSYSCDFYCAKAERRTDATN